MALFAPKPHQQPIGSQPSRGPGAQLIQARERWGMSREQVADTLHLPGRVIAALEQDHYEDLPPPAFVRGYISGYARLVGLDAKPLVEACEMRGCGDPALAAKESLSLRKGRGETLLRWGSYAALLAFLSSAVLYWVDHEDSTTVLPITTLDSQRNSVDPASASPDDGSEQTGQEQQARIASSTPGSTVGATIPASKQAYGKPAPSVVATAATATTDTSPSNTVAAEWPTLELKFSADSWLAVRDADGKRLAWETVKAGSTRQLQGVPPLKVVLGNAEAVRISYQGESFDPTPFTIGRMARFSVE